MDNEQLKRIADALEEVIRLVKQDQEESKKDGRKKMNKYTIAQILTAWEAAYGEDMTTEYPGFIQRLTEEDEQKN